MEKRVAESLGKRFSINSTAYGACTCGHAWITIDGKIVANFCTRAFFNRGSEYDDEREKWVQGPVPDELPGKTLKYQDGQGVAYGELSRQDAYEACWDFVHHLGIEEALESTDPLIQTLAVIDARIGKRRLLKIDPDKLHGLALKLYKLRLEAEGLPFKRGIE